MDLGEDKGVYSVGLNSSSGNSFGMNGGSAVHDSAQHACQLCEIGLRERACGRSCNGMSGMRMRRVRGVCRNLFAEERLLIPAVERHMHALDRV